MSARWECPLWSFYCAYIIKCGIIGWFWIFNSTIEFSILFIYQFTSCKIRENFFFPPCFKNCYECIITWGQWVKKWSKMCESLMVFQMAESVYIISNILVKCFVILLPSYIFLVCNFLIKYSFLDRFARLLIFLGCIKYL